MTDWQNRGGQTQASVVLPPMDLNKEHVFELVSIDFHDGVTENYKGKAQTVNKCVMIWKEADKEKDFHRVWVNVNEFYSEKSNLMKFLVAASGKPFIAGVTIKIGEYLQEHHRIKVRVLAKIGKDGAPNGYYKFIEQSIRPANVSQPAPVGISSAVLQNALLICRGCQNATDAAFRLGEAKASDEVRAAFETACRNGVVKFPII